MRAFLLNAYLFCLSPALTHKHTHTGSISITPTVDARIGLSCKKMTKTCLQHNNQTAHARNIIWPIHSQVSRSRPYTHAHAYTETCINSQFKLNLVTSERQTGWEKMRWHYPTWQGMGLHVENNPSKTITTNNNICWAAGGAAFPNRLALRWRRSFIGWPAAGLHDTTEADNT